jgi:glycosyltransferase involved in cell wall biosynthesis
MKVAVVGAGTKNGEQGGAEQFYQGLVSALNERQVEAELICPVSDETDFETIKESYLRFYDLDLSEFDGVISTKAPAYIIRHPNHICYLQHAMRVFYDMFEFEFPCPTRELIEQREFIQALDSSALQYPRIKKVYVISHEVKKRLLEYNRVESESLYQGLLADNFKEGAFDYVFMPGRLHRWKRVDLVIDSMKHVKASVKLKIAGVGEDADKFREMAGGDCRIEFLGRVSEEALTDLYSNALCVPFVPIREDYGLVTIEAFRSGKPVITCVDSGEPTCFVKDALTGFICEPSPKIIAEKIDWFFSNPDKAAAMGLRARQSVEHIKWDNVVDKLINSLNTP